MDWLFKLVVLYVALTILAIVTLYLTALPDSSDATGFSQLTIAHRGDGLNFPENSLPAIKGAKKLNANAVEVDVMMSSDGVLVAMHDPTLDRTTNGSGLVADHTFVELSKLRLKGNSDASIPSLEEVVQLIQELDLKLEIEMKTEIERKYEASVKVAQLFEKYKLEKQAFVSSFDPRFLYYLRSENPKIVTALAIKRHPPYHKLIEFIIRRDGFVDYLGAGIIEPSVDIADSAFIEKWLAKGKVINVWTVNSQREKAVFKNQPITITTDCPGSYC
ncbi:glycerophosphodiester phosphodiesterase [Sneathiella aquimaris]|uniref:glycerophosphodiester phosphodiesterase n=1 Tax=Sneathiella aquimaris TaxID=2599305 RepID=UPI00146CF739|nr:glycerophosphodiester phosphodiesterase family protein [Sneathiella aquimaris]